MLVDRQEGAVFLHFALIGMGGAFGADLKDAARAVGVADPFAHRWVELCEKLWPAIDLPPGAHRHFVVDKDEGRGEGPIVELWAVGCHVEPAERDAKGNLTLRDPAHVGGLQGHAAIVQDHQIDIGDEGFELDQMRGLVEVAVTKRLQTRQAGAQREDRHCDIAERERGRHLQ